MRRVTKPLRSVRLVDIGHVVPYLLALKLAYRMLDVEVLIVVGRHALHLQDIEKLVQVIYGEKIQLFFDHVLLLLCQIERADELVTRQLHT